MDVHAIATRMPLLFTYHCYLNANVTCMLLLFACHCCLHRKPCSKQQAALLPSLQTDTTCFCCAPMGQQLVGVSFNKLCKVISWVWPKFASCGFLHLAAEYAVIHLLTWHSLHWSVSMHAGSQPDDFACMQDDHCVQHACLLILHCSETPNSVAGHSFLLVR